MPNLKLGDTVRNKESGKVGTLVYSTFGFSVSGSMPGGGRWHTVGAPADELAKYWEVVEDEQPV